MCSLVMSVHRPFFLERIATCRAPYLVCSRISHRNHRHYQRSPFIVLVIVSTDRLATVMASQTGRLTFEGPRRTGTCVPSNFGMTSYLPCVPVIPAGKLRSSLGTRTSDSKSDPSYRHARCRTIRRSYSRTGIPASRLSRPFPKICYSLRDK